MNPEALYSKIIDEITSSLLYSHSKSLNYPQTSLTLSHPNLILTDFCDATKRDLVTVDSSVGAHVGKLVGLGEY